MKLDEIGNWSDIKRRWVTGGGVDGKGKCHVEGCDPSFPGRKARDRLPVHLRNGSTTRDRITADGNRSIRSAGPKNGKRHPFNGIAGPNNGKREPIDQIRGTE